MQLSPKILQCMYYNITSRNLEKKLIDDLIVITGISIKPTDLQFKEFHQRFKSLKKCLIIQILFDRLISFKDSGDLKSVQRCLFVIESIISSKCSESLDFYKTKAHEFEEIRSIASSNKKIVEIIDSIINGLGLIVGESSKKKIEKNFIIGKGEHKKVEKEDPFNVFEITHSSPVSDNKSSTIQNMTELNFLELDTKESSTNSNKQKQEESNKSTNGIEQKVNINEILDLITTVNNVPNNNSQPGYRISQEHNQIKPTAYYDPIYHQTPPYWIPNQMYPQPVRYNYPIYGYKPNPPINETITFQSKEEPKDYKNEDKLKGKLDFLSDMMKSHK